MASGATTAALARELNNVGFDICQSFETKWYNDLIDADNLAITKLPPQSQGLLIGNTKHLWPYFIDWCRRKDQVTKLPKNSLDDYCETSITGLLNRHMMVQRTLYWSHSLDASLICMQRIAVVSGLAYHDPNTKLIVHPVYGTWHAYRAVVVYTSFAAPLEPPTCVPCLLSLAEQEQAQKAIQEALSLCSLDRLRDGLEGDKVTQSTAEAWMRLRDCVETGKKGYRYDHNQLYYHHTADMQYIRAAMRDLSK